MKIKQVPSWLDTTAVDILTTVHTQRNCNKDYNKDCNKDCTKDCNKSDALNTKSIYK